MAKKNKLILKLKKIKGDFYLYIIKKKFNNFLK